MVAVFCFCWGPYASFAMINISGHGKVDNDDDDDDDDDDDEDDDNKMVMEAHYYILLHRGNLMKQMVRRHSQGSLAPPLAIYGNTWQYIFNIWHYMQSAFASSQNLHPHIFFKCEFQ